MTKIKATMLTQSVLGNVVATPIWLIETGRAKFAQYRSAPFVTYIKKNERKAKKLTIADRTPFLVIVAGWQDLSQDAFNGADGKFMSCDPAWLEEFEKETKLTDIIADYRGINTYEEISK